MGGRGRGRLGGARGFERLGVGWGKAHGGALVGRMEVVGSVSSVDREWLCVTFGCESDSALRFVVYLMRVRASTVHSWPSLYDTEYTLFKL
jgi:hypothetical protein